VITKECYWFYVVTNCGTKAQLQEPIIDLARLERHELTKVAHYCISVDALTRPMQVREECPPYGNRDGGV